MRQRIVALALAALMSPTMAVVQPVAAQGDGCRAFGQNVATLTTNLGVAFGETASSNPPLNRVVELEQNFFWE